MLSELLLKNLTDALSAAKAGEGKYIPVDCRAGSGAGRNQFLFFMKPELTDNTRIFGAVAK